ncbi:MAG: hypothetical protein Kow0068_16020 [Marinilabiliales bacterium]
MKLYHKLLYLVLSAFSGVFSACTKYGTPYAEYIIEGNVTDTNDIPINNISINIYSNGHHENQTLTTLSGNYYVHGEYYDLDSTKWEIIVEDVDGEEDGGVFTPAGISFVTRTNDISTDQYYEKDNRYDKGTLYRNINFVLQKKETE